MVRYIKSTTRKTVRDTKQSIRKEYFDLLGKYGYDDIPEPDNQSIRSRYQEADCIDIIHSILLGGRINMDQPKEQIVEEILNDRFLRVYVNLFGRDRVRELILPEIDEYQAGTLDRGFDFVSWTDDNGQYRSKTTFREYK